MSLKHTKEARDGKIAATGKAALVPVSQSSGRREMVPAESQTAVRKRITRNILYKLCRKRLTAGKGEGKRSLMGPARDSLEEQPKPLINPSESPNEGRAKDAPTCTFLIRAPVQPSWNLQ